MRGSIMILYGANVITLILGAFLLGISIYVAVTFSAGWSTFFSFNAIYLGIAAGVFMILVSFLGCAAAKTDQDKKLVFCYLIFVSSILALQVAAAIIIMQYSGFISEQNGIVSSDLLASASITLNNGILSSYTACCSGCPLTITNQPTCNNAEPYFANITASNCANQNLTCAMVPVCGGGFNDTCYQFEDGATVLTPPVKVDVSVCTLLSELSQNGSTLVGPAATGSCGGGNPASFEINMVDYFSTRFYWVAIAFCVVAGIQGLIVLATIYILCCVTRKYKA